MRRRCLVQDPMTIDPASAISGITEGNTDHSLGAQEAMRRLIARWRNDPGGTYRSWFLWEERLKNFRSIRRGIAEVVSEIDAGT